MDLAPDLRLLDEIAADATVSPIEADVAGWRCKAAPELPFRRCNVASPPTDAGADGHSFTAALDEVRRWYHDRGLRLIVQVSTAMVHPAAVDGWLAADGLTVEAPVHILVSEAVSEAVPDAVPGQEAPSGQESPYVASGQRRGAGRSERRSATVTVTAGIDETWADVSGVVHGGDATAHTRALAYGRMFAELGDRALGASAMLDGQVVGVGFAVLDRGWLGIFGMGTAPAHRRQGIASDVVSALRAAAAARGVHRAYLQVEVDNAAALRLYEGLGFRHSHDYHYRSEGTDLSQGC